MGITREQLEAGKAALNDPIEDLAQAWILTTGGEDLPLRFHEDVALMLRTASPERIRSAIMEASNRASVSRERRWSYVLTSLNYYLTALDHPSMHTPAEQKAEREEVVEVLRTRVEARHEEPTGFPFLLTVLHAVCRGLIMAGATVGALVAGRWL